MRSMEQNYEKYKERLRKHVFYTAIASAIASLSCVLILFLPIFRINLIESYIYLDFSLFDEVKLAIDGFKNGSGPFVGFSIYSIIGVLSICTALVMMIIDSVKKVMQLQNVEKFAMFTYDDILYRKEKKSKRFNRNSPWNFMWSGIVLILIQVLFMRYFSNMLDGSISELGDLSTYMLYVNGVSFWAFVVIVIFVGSVAVNIYAKRIYNKVKTEIIEEDYKIKKQEQIDSEASVKNSDSETFFK